MLPKLQIALDNVSYAEALKTLSNGVGDEVDIIEVGTVLIYAEGHRAVEYIRAQYPDKEIIADVKMADAGLLVPPLFFNAGADRMSIICSADLATMKTAQAEALKVGKELQVELYGRWDFDLAKAWRDIGIPQIIYHRSMDAHIAGAEWSDADFENVGRLCDLGYEVTVAGGLNPDNVYVFKDYPIYAFVAGRSLRSAKNPVEEVRRFKESFKANWK
jgi:3-dehydro-L-gulonate-6-phosphate decarboxylase